ncbi:hypothetical protein ACFYUV_35150 [Nonomuraea sp. NPDC003560]|uniref:hypothetical protein n=1 Tax=Nonomuraea sp. NPDC003560 TaxID=3364341 RepID=UPI00368EFCB7
MLERFPLPLAETGVATTASGDPVHTRLAEMRDFYRFLLAELPGLLHRWEQTRTPR